MFIIYCGQQSQSALGIDTFTTPFSYTRTAVTEVQRWLAQKDGDLSLSSAVANI